MFRRFYLDGGGAKNLKSFIKLFSFFPFLIGIPKYSFIYPNFHLFWLFSKTSKKKLKKSGKILISEVGRRDDFSRKYTISSIHRPNTLNSKIYFFYGKYTCIPKNRHFSWKQTLVPNTDIFSFTEEIAYWFTVIFPCKTRHLILELRYLSLCQVWWKRRIIFPDLSTKKQTKIFDSKLKNWGKLELAVKQHYF